MAGEIVPLLFRHLLKLPAGCRLERNSFETYAHQPVTVLQSLLKQPGPLFARSDKNKLSLATDSAARPVNVIRSASWQFWKA